MTILEAMRKTKTLQKEEENHKKRNAEDKFRNREWTFV